MDTMKKYENIMGRLKELADENNMVCLDAVAEVVNQELDSNLLAWAYCDEQLEVTKTPALNTGNHRLKR